MSGMCRADFQNEDFRPRGRSCRGSLGLVQPHPCSRTCPHRGWGRSVTPKGLLLCSRLKHALGVRPGFVAQRDSRGHLASDPRAAPQSLWQVGSGRGRARPGPAARGLLLLRAAAPPSCREPSASSAALGNLDVDVLSHAAPYHTCGSSDPSGSLPPTPGGKQKWPFLTLI